VTFQNRRQMMLIRLDCALFYFDHCLQREGMFVSFLFSFSSSDRILCCAEEPFQNLTPWKTHALAEPAESAHCFSDFG